MTTTWIGHKVQIITGHVTFRSCYNFFGKATESSQSDTQIEAIPASSPHWLDD